MPYPAHTFTVLRFDPSADFEFFQRLIRPAEYSGTHPKRSRSALLPSGTKACLSMLFHLLVKRENVPCNRGILEYPLHRHRIVLGIFEIEVVLRRINRRPGTTGKCHCNKEN